MRGEASHKLDACCVYHINRATPHPPFGHILPSRGEGTVHHNACRHAFTLIEVLIALSLSLLLISAVYAAISMHYRYSTLGRGAQLRNQITRAVIRKMTQDVSSIVFRLPEEVSDEDETVIQDEAERVDNSALTIGGIEEASAPITFGVVGSATMLHLSISKPSRDLNYVGLDNVDNPTGRTSDLIAASYGISPVDPLNNKLDSLGQPTREVSLQTIYQPNTGLGRRLIDLYATESSPEELDESHLIASEISEVTFRYFDGADWLDAWDSRETQVLPRAIEVTFGFWNKPKPNTQQQGLSLNTTTPVTYISHIFHVPMSVPEVIY